MAQIFVNRNDLVIEDVDHPVKIIASYANDAIVTVDMHGAAATVLSVADTVVNRNSLNARQPFPTLTATWRNDYKPVINAEAQRRIYDVFADYKQRNYTAAVQGYITQYGADATVWPQPAKDVKTEGDRGWTYVTAVRTAANAWTAMPGGDPTADSIWPTVISPIK